MSLVTTVVQTASLNLSALTRRFRARRVMQVGINSVMIVLTLVWPIVHPLQVMAADFY